ncbi:hypothetical protein B0T14DRAFT_96097 [Immersiella caudata]|uniref:Secreted protein n=1 Tax=Immersiella caudata TaxID=314043 RepID=A0AA40C6N8_9PEZI|nr:hypothetical protein B0T14DRAFT_96097 [Immersiella caudata]
MKLFIWKALTLESAKAGAAAEQCLPASEPPRFVTSPSLPPTMTTNFPFLSQHSRGGNSPGSSMTAPTTPPWPVARMSMRPSPTGSFETGPVECRLPSKHNRNLGRYSPAETRRRSRGRLHLGMQCHTLKRFGRALTVVLCHQKHPGEVHLRPRHGARCDASHACIHPRKDGENL